METRSLPSDQLGFAQEAGASVSSPQPLESVAARETAADNAEKKKRQSRTAGEIACLQTQLAAFALQLKTIKQARAAGTNVLLMHGSYWRTEAKLESKLRLAAQEENERLRAQLQAQKQIATRLLNMIKRRPSSRILQTLDRYEREARVRCQTMDIEFDQAFLKTDAVLAAAGLLHHSVTISETQQKPGGQQGCYIQFRRRLSLPHDLVTASQAVWNFTMHESLRKRFIYDHIDNVVSDDVNGYTCRFRPRHAEPGPMHFRGEFLQRRYRMADRVVIVRKFHVQDSSRYFPMCGRGYIVIERATAMCATPTVLLSTAWFSPESDSADLSAAQQDPRFLAQMDFLKHAAECYTAFIQRLCSSQAGTSIQRIQ